MKHSRSTSFESEADRRRQDGALSWHSRSTRLFPLSGSFVIAGILAGLLMGAVFRSVEASLGTAVLFVICGLTWRSDMPPIFPFCFAFQWVGAFLGTIFYLHFGYFPGGGDTSGLVTLLWASMLGFACLAVGVRAGMAVFSADFRRVLAHPTPNYDVTRLSILVGMLFAANFMFDVSPMSIWFGGAQMIANLLSLRFVPYFMLVLFVFERGRGYNHLVLTTAAVVLPEFLTGFSGFKEIFFVVLLSALYQWRPWVKTARQQSRNVRILAGGAACSVLIATFGLVWSGGVKDQWRQILWYSDEDSSPIERMGQFLEVVATESASLDMQAAAETLATRLSSGSLFFSRVLERVPEEVDHERGELLTRAIENATMPRFLFPEKANLGGDSWLVRKYAGMDAAGDESGASIGLGYMPEFYVDFGYLGLALLCCTYGFGLVFLMRVLAWASRRSGSVFIALSFSLLMNYFSVFDASFAKLLAGMIQHTIITGIATWVLAPMVTPWLTRSNGLRRPLGIGMAAGHNGKR